MQGKGGSAKGEPGLRLHRCAAWGERENGKLVRGCRRPGCVWVT